MKLWVKITQSKVLQVLSFRSMPWKMFLGYTERRDIDRWSARRPPDGTFLARPLFVRVGAWEWKRGTAVGAHCTPYQTLQERPPGGHPQNRKSVEVRQTWLQISFSFFLTLILGESCNFSKLQVSNRWSEENNACLLESLWGLEIICVLRTPLTF